jgi:hypothetical protein
MALDDLYIKHGAASFDKQVYFEVMLGKLGWGLDLSTGVIAFRRPHDVPLQLNFQVLGTESEAHKSWLWGWANTTQGFKPELLMTALELKVQGDKLGVPEFNTAEIPLSVAVNGARISAVASGLCRAGCFVRATYPGGALFLLIRDPRFKRPVSQPIQRMLRAFPMFLSDNTIANQREAWLSYCQFYKLAVEDMGARVIARSAAEARTQTGLVLENAIMAEFDDSGRMTRFEGIRV